MMNLLASIQGQIDDAWSQTGASTDIKSGIGTALMWVFGLIGIVAVIVVVIGGVNIATSQGDPARVKKGRMAITYGLIGMAVCLLAFAIVGLVLNELAKG